MGSFLHYSFESSPALMWAGVYHLFNVAFSFFSSCSRDARRVGHYGAIVQVERLSKETSLKCLPVVLSRVFLSCGSRSGGATKVRRGHGSDALLLCVCVCVCFFFFLTLQMKMALKSSDAFMPTGARVNICSHDAEAEWGVSVALFFTGHSF